MDSPTKLEPWPTAIGDAVKPQPMVVERTRDWREVTSRFVGATLADQYRILEVIGEGGMGVVFRARQLNVNRDVAVKVLHRRLASDHRAVAQFENEAKIISQLRHPNTLRLYDCLRTPDGEFLIVTELLTGAPLAKILASKGRLATDLACRIIDGVLGSLAEAHAAGIVHRDLKPENVFIDRVRTEDIVKVLDFGIARITEGVECLTLPGRINGTPIYMAPEQIRGERADHRTDLYALGIMFYEMLAGTPPFTEESIPKLLEQHLDLAPEPLRSKAPKLGVTAELERLILQLLEKDRAKRPQSVDELRLRLSRVTGLTAPQSALFSQSGPDRAISSDLTPQEGVSSTAPRILERGDSGVEFDETVFDPRIVGTSAASTPRPSLMESRTTPATGDESRWSLPLVRPVPTTRESDRTEVRKPLGRPLQGRVAMRPLIAGMLLALGVALALFRAMSRETPNAFIVSPVRPTEIADEPAPATLETAEPADKPPSTSPAPREKNDRRRRAPGTAHAPRAGSKAPPKDENGRKKAPWSKPFDIRIP